MALVLLSDTPRRAALRAWIGGAGYFAAALHWIVEPFLVDIARHGWMAPFALVFLSFGLALFWGAAGWVAGALGRTHGRRAVALIVALSLAELARGYVLTGFPWALIGHLWIDTPAVQLAAFGGAPLLTLLALGVATAPVTHGARGLVFSVALVGACWGFGLIQSAAFLQPPASAPVVRLVQPNAPQREKWDPEHVPVFFDRQIAMTAAPDLPAPDLIIWPEMSVAYRLTGEGGVAPYIARAAQGRPVVVGYQRREAGAIYNALGVVGPEGGLRATYDKFHLVPFGEYFPLQGLAARFGLFGMAANGGFGYASGPGPQVLNLGPLGRVLPLICYEAIFPGHARGPGPRPDWILQITNDAWFGNFSGPYQHLAQARLRAVETGLPLVRVANTGVSAVIDGKGRIRGQIPLNTEGALNLALPPAHPPTLYAAIGDLPLAGVLILALLLLIGMHVRHRR